MALWDDQGMARGDGIAVVDGEGVVVGQDDFRDVRGAEGATGFNEFFHCYCLMLVAIPVFT